MDCVQGGAGRRAARSACPGRVGLAFESGRLQPFGNVRGDRGDELRTARYIFDRHTRLTAERFWITRVRG